MFEAAERRFIAEREGLYACQERLSAAMHWREPIHSPYPCREGAKDEDQDYTYWNSLLSAKKALNNARSHTTLPEASLCSRPHRLAIGLKRVIRPKLFRMEPIGALALLRASKLRARLQRTR